jgi:Mrp family chromosome partitioning ATPase
LVLVARAGMTRSDNAERSIELLNRLDVPLAGIVLVGTATASNDYYYYYQPGRVAQGAGGRRGTRLPSGSGNGNGQAPEAEMFGPEAEAEPSQTD